MTRPSGVIERPKIKVDGQVVSAELLNDLIDIRVETTVSRPAQATLRFIDYEFELLDETKMTIGATIDISFVAIEGSTPADVFHGEVTSLGVEAGPDDVPVTVVTAQDLAHRLGRNSRHRVFAQQTYGDMVKAIIGAAGMSAKTTGLDLTFEHITQDVDDAAFIDEICRRSNLIWRVVGTTFTMEAAKIASPAVEVSRGVSLRRFRAQFDSAELVDSVTVHGWDPKTKADVVGVSRSAPASLTSATLVSTSRSKASSAFGATKATNVNVMNSVDEATLLATSLHARSVADELRVRGEADGNPAIVAGSTIKISKVGTKLSGNYFVTAAEHVYSSRDYVTRFTCGGTRPATLADLVRSGPAPQRVGPAIGVVTNVGSGEFVGQVKVKLPTVGENLESAWARVVMPGGGAQRGLQLMPSVNDEVLVVFENGDLRRPFVVGGLWNPKDKLPFAGFLAGSEVTEWTLKDRAGHALSFRNGKGDNKQNIELLLADGSTKLYLGKDKVELWATDGKPLQLKSGQGSITITANGDIEIKGTKVTITAVQELAGKGATVKLNADSTMAIQAQATLELKSSASAKLDGGGMTEVKGGMVKIN